MPRKIRQLRADLAKAGFVKDTKRGRGSHTYWEHPQPQRTLWCFPGMMGMTPSPTRRKQSAKPCNGHETWHDIMRYIREGRAMHYSMLIEWSDEDQAYLVTFPEWADHVNTPTTHGATYEEAVKHGQEVLEDLVSLWQERGYPLPTPRVHVSI